MKLDIFGASVSAQTRNRKTDEITGYVEILRRDYQEELGFDEIRQVTYPGNRLSDGGLFRLADVQRGKADICLFEPLIEDTTRGVVATSTEIEHVYHTLLDRGILPVLLMLPMPNLRPVAHHPTSVSHEAIATRLGVPVICVNLSEEADLDAKFRGVHTLYEGARIYAAQIAEGLRRIGTPSDWLVNLPPRKKGLELIKVRPFVLPDPVPSQVRTVRLIAKTPERQKGIVRIVQRHAIGPFSPVLDVTLKARNPEDEGQWIDIAWHQMSVWDPYCHFERETILPLFDFTMTGYEEYDLTLQCTAVDPDYASSRQILPRWPAPQDRFLKPVGELKWISEIPLRTRIITYT